MALVAPILPKGFKPHEIPTWLKRCQRAHKTYADKKKKLSTGGCIRDAGLAMMEDERSATWWEENAEKLEDLKTWEEFAVQVMEAFAPEGWQLEGEHQLWNLTQGTEDYASWSTRLISARSAIGGSAAVSDDILKSLLLHRAHETLYLRVIATPNFRLKNYKTIDSLVAHMTATYNGLVAEGVKLDAKISPSTTRSPTAIVRLPKLSEEDRERLRQIGGCFRCRKTNTGHTARNCPGDPALGIKPASDYVKVKKEGEDNSEKHNSNTRISKLTTVNWRRPKESEDESLAPDEKDNWSDDSRLFSESD